MLWIYNRIMPRLRLDNIPNLDSTESIDFAGVRAVSNSTDFGTGTLRSTQTEVWTVRGFVSRWKVNIDKLKAWLNEYK